MPGNTKISAAFLVIIIFLTGTIGRAEFMFSDTRFQNDYSTENLDRIIDEYELFDGWYWTTNADITQDFHGHPECPGWTSTADKYNRSAIKAGWYGCRWPVDHVRKTAPEQGGYAECFAFAQFIGYLLSGEINPQHHWKFYYTMEAAGGLRVGDIVRVEYRKNKKQIQHSAVVYSINGDEILFLQVSGGSCNRISVSRGFSDSVVMNATTEDEIAAIPGLKISRHHTEQENNDQD